MGDELYANPEGLREIGNMLRGIATSLNESTNGMESLVQDAVNQGYAVDSTYMRRTATGDLWSAESEIRAFTQDGQSANTTLWQIASKLGNIADQVDQLYQVITNQAVMLGALGPNVVLNIPGALPGGAAQSGQIDGMPLATDGLLLGAGVWLKRSGWEKGFVELYVNGRLKQTIPIRDLC